MISHLAVHSPAQVSSSVSSVACGHLSTSSLLGVLGLCTKAVKDTLEVLLLMLLVVPCPVVCSDPVDMKW